MATFTQRPTWEQAEDSPLPLGVTWIEALLGPGDFSDLGLPLEQMKYVVAPRSVVVLLRPRRIKP